MTSPDLESFPVERSYRESRAGNSRGLRDAYRRRRSPSRRRYIPLSFITKCSKDLKCGQYLEWCTKLPSNSVVRNSPVFLLKSNECFFQFSRNNPCFSDDYAVDLKLERKFTDFEPSYVYFQVGFKEEEICLHEDSFEISEDSFYFYDSTNIWSITEEDLESKLPPDYDTDNCYIQFLFYFDGVLKPALKINTETDDTAVQTPKYMDTHFQLDSISKDLSKLFEEDATSDVEFICNEEILKAHKTVLCCRSDVFASMFQTDMIENETGQVKIQDMEVSILRLFLKYLYTGVFPDVTIDIVKELYEAADKYAIDSLKEQCTSFLTENLTPDNACEILVYANQSSDPDFKKNVMEYMIKSKMQFMEEKWIGFCKENPSLANEVFNLFCESLQRD